MHIPGQAEFFRTLYGSFAVTLGNTNAPQDEPPPIRQVRSPVDHAAFYRSPVHRGWLSHYRDTQGIVSFTDRAVRVRLPYADMAADEMVLDDFLKGAGYTCSFLDIAAPGLRPLGVYVVRCFAPEAVLLAFGISCVPELIPLAPIGQISDDAVMRPHPFA